MDDEEKLLCGLFLNSGVRDAEMQNREYADFNCGECLTRLSASKFLETGIALRLDSKGSCPECRTARGVVPLESRCTPRAQTVHLSTVFSPFGLTLNEEQIPQIVEKQ